MNVSVYVSDRATGVERHECVCMSICRSVGQLVR